MPRKSLPEKNEKFMRAEELKYLRGDSSRTKKFLDGSPNTHSNPR